MTDYIKHIVKCKCILPQLKYKIPPIFHSFIVFSVVEDDGEIRPSFAQCTNCGVIHKVTEVGTSSIIRKEELSSLITIDEIKKTLPENITKLLEPYELSLPTWQEIQFVLENKLWDVRKEPIPIILSKEEIEGVTTGKYLAIFGESLVKINTFTREEFVSNG